MSSDSQAMGRVGEVITRTWQTADKMKKQRGGLPEDIQVREDKIVTCLRSSATFSITIHLKLFLIHML